MLATQSGRALMDGRGNPLVPESLQRELQEIHPRLAAVYYKPLWAFALVMKWTADDPRHRLVAEGKLTPGAEYEILGTVPAYVRLDEIGGYARRVLERVSTNRADVRAMIERNDAQTKASNDAMVEAKAAEIVDSTFTGTSKNINVGKRRTHIRSIT